MLLAYLDESYDKRTFLTAALIVPEADAQPLSDAFDDIAMDWAHVHRTVDAEFHGVEILNQNKTWARLTGDIDRALELYGELLDAIASFDVTIFVEGVDRKALAARYPHWPRSDSLEYAHRTTAMYAIERVQEHAKRQKELALVIADVVDNGTPFRRDLAEFRKWNTPGYKSQPLSNIIDTIHFSPSNTSRLLQAADLIAHLTYRRWLTNVHPKAEAAQEQLWERLESRVGRLRRYVPDPQ